MMQSHQTPHLSDVRLSCGGDVSSLPLHIQTSDAEIAHVSLSWSRYFLWGLNALHLAAGGKYFLLSQTAPCHAVRGPGQRSL